MFKRRPTACNQVVDPCLTAWVNSLKEHVVMGLKRSRSFWRGRSEFSNTLPLIRFAKSIMVNNQLVPIITDKDGGYAIEQLWRLHPHSSINFSKRLVCRRSYGQHYWSQNTDARISRFIQKWRFEFQSSRMTPLSLPGLCRPYVVHMDPSLRNWSTRASPTKDLARSPIHQCTLQRRIHFWA